MKNKSCFDVSFLQMQYQVLANKQQMHNTLVWSVPALLFTAESILWGIMFENLPDEIRCGVSLISALVAFASWQQFERWRLLEVADSEQLCAIEETIRNMADQSGAFSETGEAVEPSGIMPAMIVHHRLKYRTIFIAGENFCKEASLESYLIERKHNNPLGHIPTFLVWRIMFIIVILFSIALFVYSLLLYFDILAL